MVDLLVSDVLDSAVGRFAHRTAIALGDRRMTFAEVAEQTDAVAHGLVAAGIGPGDRVGWLAPTSLEAVAVYFACARLGAIFAPFNPGSSADELTALIELADPAIVAGVDDHPGASIDYGALTERHPSAPFTTRGVAETDCMVIFFTSGTTGRPKGAMLSHRAERLRAGAGTEPLGPHVSMFPQFHMAGWAFSLSTWLRGDAVVYVERADAGHLLDAVERHHAHSIYCIPAVWRRILETDLGRRDLSSLRVADTGTSATAPELLRQVKAAFPATTTSVAYGSTEAARVCMLYDPDIERKPYSVGPAAPGAFVRLDEHGELWVKNTYLFSGYFRDEAATARALVDGWYRTGELAERDDEGYYFIVGRANDLIRTGGETVAPAEVDAVLQSHPDLSDAAVVGVPDPEWGEIVTAFVVARPGRAIAPESIRDHCARSLAKHKVPRRVSEIEEIPRTGATGQVQRARLIDMISTG